MGSMPSDRRNSGAVATLEQLLSLVQGGDGWRCHTTELATGRWETSPELDDLLGLDETVAREVSGWGSILHPDDRARVLREYQDLVARATVWRAEYRVRRPRDGQEVRVAHLACVECDARGAPVRVLGCLRDVGERRSPGNPAGDLERVQAAGALALVAAHDLKNVFATILMATEVLRPGRSKSAAAGYLDIIAESANRGAGMGQQVMTLLAAVGITAPAPVPGRERGDEEPLRREPPKR